MVGDVRSDDDVARAVDQTVERFGGIDIVVNNASAIDLSSTAYISMKRYDLMQDINTRGSFLLAKTALPYLRRSRNLHVLTLSPPIDLDPRWAGSYLAYTIAKYGMSLVTLGLSAEWRGDGIAATPLWPRTTIATAAVQNLLGGDEIMSRSRSQDIMADAAHAVLTRDSRTCSGNFFLDDEVLAEEGATDLARYRLGGSEDDLEPDLFVADHEASPARGAR